MSFLLQVLLVVSFNGFGFEIPTKTAEKQNVFLRDKFNKISSLKIVAVDFVSEFVVQYCLNWLAWR